MKIHLPTSTVSSCSLEIRISWEFLNVCDTGAQILLVQETPSDNLLIIGWVGLRNHEIYSRRFGVQSTKSNTHTYLQRDSIA